MGDKFITADVTLVEKVLCPVNLSDEVGESGVSCYNFNIHNFNIFSFISIIIYVIPFY